MTSRSIARIPTTSLSLRVAVAAVLAMGGGACSAPTEDVGQTELGARRARSACSDRQDNDGDGKTDLNDPGCSSKSDNDETDPAAPPPPPPPPPCTPTTCEAEAKNCGTIADGCGGTLTCGSCTSPQTCGGGGTANVCGGGGAGSSQFRLVFSDDFDGSDLDANWSKYGATSDWPGHGGNGLRVGRAISVAGGIATITATPAADTATGELESGGFTIRAPYRLTYGRYETRLRVDDDPSRVTSAVALLWNADESTNPWCAGESDFYETGTSRSGWNTFLHYEIGTPNCSDSTTQWYYKHASDPRLWHDVALEWTPNRYEVFVDGVSDGVTTKAEYIPDWAQRLTFQLDAMNSGTLAQPVKMQIDYARIYEYVP